MAQPTPIQATPVFSLPSRCFDDEFIAGVSRALKALGEAASRLIGGTPACISDHESLSRGHFRPAEEEEIFSWFARFLTIRSEIREFLRELSEPVGGKVSRVINTFQWRCFVLGYTAACHIVRLDQHLVEEAASESLLQRKLNEGNLKRRIPRKQFTRIFESFTDPGNAKAMHEATRFSLGLSHRPVPGVAILEAVGEDLFAGNDDLELDGVDAGLDLCSLFVYSELDRTVYLIRSREESIQDATREGHTGAPHQNRIGAFPKPGLFWNRSFGDPTKGPGDNR